jgi:hypothetical protein
MWGYWALVQHIVLFSDAEAVDDEVEGLHGCFVEV